ncbi:hypothetical protein HD806DRAFT_539348 [Xylariaceae sp. AK1471]|nr:hypothetical protein HD806DRAFT_539348 [Xylariaceae sp. AK1471]
MSDMAPPRSFGAIEARNALAGNNFSGHTNITINGSQDNVQPPQPPQAPKTLVYRSIPFPPNEDLVYRSDVTGELDRLLPVPATSDYQTAALWGLGGSGKTQIALAYAYNRCRDPACSVFWVHADSETSFTQDYQSIARKLGLPNSLDGEDLLQAVREHIDANPRWVLVLDNADDLGLFGVDSVSSQQQRRQQQRPDSTKSTLNLNAFVPRGPTGTVLWTSRDRQIAGSLVGARRAIHIAQMIPKEAETLLETVRNEETKEGEYDSVKELLAELDCLPLPISQAAAYMRRTSTSVGDYISEIQKRKRRWKLLERSEHDRHRRTQVSNSILETWDISVEHLRKENELTYDVLHSLAFVDNQDIPFELIREAARLNKKKMTPPNQRNNDEESDSNEDSENEDDDYRDIVDVTTRLCEFSFLSIRTSSEKSQTKAYEMHKLVQEAARYRLQRSEVETRGEAYFARAAFQITDHLFPNSRREVWERCEQYLVHAQQAGAWAKLHKGEAEVAELLMRVSDYLYHRGRWREQEAVAMKAFCFRQKIIGKRHPDTIRNMANLAEAYFGQGRYEEAEKMDVEVLQLRRDVLGERYPDTIRGMVNLAITYCKQGRYEEAEKMNVEALQLWRDVLGERHPDTIRCMANLATTYRKQRRYEEAEKMNVEALQLQREVLGERHPDMIGSMTSLAMIYYKQGRYEEAEKMNVEALQLWRDVLGERHPDTICSIATLAVIYRRQRRYEEAEKMDVKALQLRQDVLGERHPDTIGSMANLATIYYEQMRYEEAEKMNIKALKLRRDVLGERHTDTIRGMANLAVIYRKQKKYAEAEKIEVELKRCNNSNTK